MRSRKRLARFVLAAVALSALGGLAPASADCTAVSVFVRVEGQNTYLLREQCVTPDTPWQQDEEPIHSSPTVNDSGVGVAVWPVTP